MAVRRLGWASSAPDGVVVSDRVRRMAEEHAARMLRLAVHRERVLGAVVASVASGPVNPRKPTREEWAVLWAAAPEGLTKVEVRNRARQTVAFLAEHGRLPESVAEVEASPYASGQVLLAAADKQQVAVTRVPDDPARLRLRVLLPAVARPASYRDW